MKYLSIIVLSLIFHSCQDYESEEYFTQEDAAIKELFPQFIDLENMISMNDYGNSTPILYVISRLDNAIQIYQDTVETILKEDSTGTYVEREISEKIVEENRLFKPLTTGALKERVISTEIQNELINIQILPDETFLAEHRNNMVDRMDKDKSIFGYLHLTRIIFNDDFTVGYLGYSFFCGSGCAWNNNIEIRKQGEKWKITKYFSGGIA